VTAADEADEKRALWARVRGEQAAVIQGASRSGGGGEGGGGGGEGGGGGGEGGGGSGDAATTDGQQGSFVTAVAAAADTEQRQSASRNDGSTDFSFIESLPVELHPGAPPDDFDDEASVKEHLAAAALERGASRGGGRGGGGGGGSQRLRGNVNNVLGGSGGVVDTFGAGAGGGVLGAAADQQELTYENVVGVDAEPSDFDKMAEVELHTS
jgi:hypothetical protein